MLSGRGLCDELITRPEESYGLCCIVVCDIETSRIGAPYIYIYIYIYDISNLRVKDMRITEARHMISVQKLLIISQKKTLNARFFYNLSHGRHKLKNEHDFSRNVCRRTVINI